MFSHFIITRFNLVYSDPKFNKDKKGNKTQTDVWLEKRFKLFEDFCLPSIKNQTNQNFKWLVLFSASTPAYFKNKNSEYSAAFPNFVPLYFDDGGHNPTMLKKAIKEMITPDKEYIITTRIDNDDAFHEEMIANIQSRFDYQKDVLINFDNGLQFDTTHKVLCEVTYLNNAFTSRIEKVNDGDFETGFFLKHTEIDKKVSVKYIQTKPLWLQIIHDGNISNSLKIKKLIFSENMVVPFHIQYNLTISKLNSFKLYLLYNKYSNLFKKMLKAFSR